MSRIPITRYFGREYQVLSQRTLSRSTIRTAQRPRYYGNSLSSSSALPYVVSFRPATWDTVQQGKIPSLKNCYSTSAPELGPTLAQGDVVGEEVEGQMKKGLEVPEFLDEQERAIWNEICAGLSPVELEVQDISHGCGSMYAIAITADKFKGMSVVKQHRLVNDLLKERIKSWHGMQLRTKAP